MNEKKTEWANIQAKPNEDIKNFVEMIRSEVLSSTLTTEIISPFEFVQVYAKGLGDTEI